MGDKKKLQGAKSGELGAYGVIRNIDRIALLVQPVMNKLVHFHLHLVSSNTA